MARRKTNDIHEPVLRALIAFRKEFGAEAYLQLLELERQREIIASEIDAEDVSSLDIVVNALLYYAAQENFVRKGGSKTPDVIVDGGSIARKALDEVGVDYLPPSEASE